MEPPSPIFLTSEQLTRQLDDLANEASVWNDSDSLYSTYAKHSNSSPYKLSREAHRSQISFHSFHELHNETGLLDVGHAPVPCNQLFSQSTMPTYSEETLLLPLYNPPPITSPPSEPQYYPKIIAAALSTLIPAIFYLVGTDKLPVYAKHLFCFFMAFCGHSLNVCQSSGE